MIHEDTEVIFPPRVIPTLTELRGEAWRELVIQIEESPAKNPHRLAFVLFMTRVCGCATCHADSFRAMRGCTQCSNQAIRRCRDSDQGLLDEFSKAYNDIEQYLSEKKG